MHRVVRGNLHTLYAAVEDGFATAALPEFVRREFESCLNCGLLCRGFAVLACEDCGERRLVAFSCRGRGFCPSCLGRRMVQIALNLIDHVPPPVGLRQFVLTLPFELRARLAYDGNLRGAVTRVFSDSVLGFYRRRLRALAAVTGRSGAVIALVTAPKSLTRFLRHLGEPTDAPAISAARDPPCFTSHAVRRALGELDPTRRGEPMQGELF